MVKYDPNKKEEDYTDEELEEFYSKVIKKRLDKRLGDRETKAKEIHAEYELTLVNYIKPVAAMLGKIAPEIHLARMARDKKLYSLCEIDPNAKWPWTSIYKKDYTQYERDSIGNLYSAIMIISTWDECNENDENTT